MDKIDRVMGDHRSLFGMLRKSFDWILLFTADDGKLEILSVYKFAFDYIAKTGSAASILLVAGCP